MSLPNPNPNVLGLLARYLIFDSHEVIIFDKMFGAAQQEK